MTLFDEGWWGLMVAGLFWPVTTERLLMDMGVFAEHSSRKHRTRREAPRSAAAVTHRFSLPTFFSFINNKDEEMDMGVFAKLSSRKRRSRREAPRGAVAATHRFSLPTFFSREKKVRGVFAKHSSRKRRTRREAPIGAAAATHRFSLPTFFSREKKVRGGRGIKKPRPSKG